MTIHNDSCYRATTILDLENLATDLAVGTGRRVDIKVPETGQQVGLLGRCDSEAIVLHSSTGESKKNIRRAFDTNLGWSMNVGGCFGGRKSNVSQEDAELVAG
jgi:hypothetical protein